MTSEPLSGAAAPGPAAPRRTLRVLCVALAPLLVAAHCGLLGARLPYVPQGGDAPAYLLAARYDPLVDNFDNPSHGWGYPALIRVVTPLVGDEYVAARVLSALSAGALTFGAAALAFWFAPPLWAALVALVVATLPCVLFAGSAALSDALFAALAALAVCCAITRPSWRGALAAGALAALSIAARGNGLVLLVALPAALLIMRRGGRAVLAFAAGAGAVLLAEVLLFAAHDAPLERLLPAGAPEMAFATLDDSGTWNERLEYGRRYPGYGALLADQGAEVAAAAGRTLWHVHDWWLLPALLVLGFFTVPGLLLWLYRPSREQLALAVAFLALQATYLWSGKFALARHVLPALPFLALVSVRALSGLPSRLAGLPLRTPLTALVLAATLVLGGRQLQQDPRFDPSAAPSILVKEQADAGRWLGEHAAPGDRVASSRLNIAWYAQLWPLNFTDLFEAGYPPRERLAAHLEAAQCRWLAWIDGHSEKAFGPLAWLAGAADFPGASVAHREGRVTIWRVHEGAAGGH